MTHLVYGGSASGKSVFAEDLVKNLPQPRIYIATMRPWDDGCLARIEKHRKQRADKGFTTIECYDDLSSVEIPQGATVLLECMGNLTTNVLFGMGVKTPHSICRALDRLASIADNLVVVSNDVFLEEPPESPEMVEYLQLLSQVNCHMAKTFDHATEVVCGIPIPM